MQGIYTSDTGLRIAQTSNAPTSKKLMCKISILSGTETTHALRLVI
jgi:hypothetical protein